jgi:hypothetical protein
MKAVEEIIQSDIKIEFHENGDDEQYKSHVRELNQKLESMQQEISATLFTELQKYKNEVEDWIEENMNNPENLKKGAQY